MGYQSYAAANADRDVHLWLAPSIPHKYAVARDLHPA